MNIEDEDEEYNLIYKLYKKTLSITCALYLTHTHKHTRYMIIIIIFSAYI